ncbi:histidinol-phosphate transaminase [Legionella spiritensis]|uniref:histidinol-phosphate transaminase n=1 Tax=Legionella spiritensis TaxID=452 RepID=UPI001E4DBC85|nr:histidinol-phosphate transaminase [Legionella spiritensis]
MMSVLDLIQPALRNIKNYQPDGDLQPCRLHANELPWAPPAVTDFALNHYPDNTLENRLREKLAGLYQVSQEHILITRGSDDGIDRLMRLFLRAGKDAILQCPPTFPMYAFYAQLQQAGILNCPLDEKEDYALSPEKLMAQWQPDCKIIVLCQPNNPTGTLLELQTIRTICEQFIHRAVVVVDEAYIEFAQTDSAAQLLSSFDNLVVLRTLSKAYGMAGLRLGAVLAQPQLIQVLQRTSAPYLLSNAVLSPALQALREADWYERRINDIIRQKEQLAAQLLRSPFIERVYPSRTNFLLVQTTHAHALKDRFQQHGIAVRHFPGAPDLHNKLRITVGDPEQNARLLAVLSTYKT